MRAVASYSGMRSFSRRGVNRVALVAAAALGALAAPSAAHAQGELCLSADPPPLTAPAQPLRFGITPQLAGTAGGSQGEVAPEDPARALEALHGLEPPRRRLVMRLNRLFESDGQAGIEHFVSLADEYRREGFAVESQIRYHPAPEQEGDMAAWEAYVRAATAALGQNPALVALTITNEVNLPLSANTSDGAYAGALDAIVRGIVAAQDELDRIGRSDVALGFSYAYRYFPDQDVAFWDGIGQRATPQFLAAMDYVGVQLYPGLFWPPAFSPGQTAGDATIEALTLVRDCYMPRAALGADVEIWVTEEGFATNLNRSLQRQVNDLTSSVEAVHAYSGTLNVTDFRYFNLRDNNSDGGDLFDAVGLLFDEYTPKPAYATYRELIERFGRDEPDAAAGELLVKLRLRCRGGDVRAKVGGPDRALLRRVVFLVRGNRVARDRGSPFRRDLPDDVFGRAERWRVVARILLVDGQRAKLRASRRACG
jgi:hypothetical protein